VSSISQGNGDGVIGFVEVMHGVGASGQAMHGRC